eukprot:Gregarina_sp_Pseudo_9__5355@NODE_641_length_2433_cov_49_071011_g605_i0_p1_GENE_NODE_641_length_2433_cov_49_071011_g605_i0NODE_641_length_2433_cov_49_071011_g605_i0_p1_ORF_typecomplete_len347_score31_76IF4E/PF01652_18/1_6e30_NODE_641_length_2433_cov_49_071011_g605_i01131153
MTDNKQVEQAASKHTDFIIATGSAGEAPAVVEASEGCNHEAAIGAHQLETEWTAWSYPRVTGTKITSLCHQRFAEEGADLKDLSPASAAANLYARDLNIRAHFSTVEDFFRTWEEVQQPSDMPSETNLAIFRDQLKPMWEAFPSGGRFVLRLRRPSAGTSKPGNKSSKVSGIAAGSNTIGSKDPALAAFVNQLWENLVFRMIGETFELPELVGAVCSMRAREVVFSLWVSNAENIALRNKVRDHLKKLIEESQSCCEPNANYPVLVQFNAFQVRLREQQRDILARVTRSRVGGRQGASTAESGSVCTAMESGLASYYYYSANAKGQQTQSTAEVESGKKILVAADC